MNWHVGQQVEKRQVRPGADGYRHLGSGVVARVSSTRVTLADGSCWRARDGYAWGSQPTRGLGRTHEPRIVAASEVP